jgi:hypothetical protein
VLVADPPEQAVASVGAIGCPFNLVQPMNGRGRVLPTVPTHRAIC